MLDYDGTPLVAVRSGHGVDTLRVLGSAVTLDLRRAALSVEIIDLTGDRDNILIVDDVAVRQLPESSAALPAALTKMLEVLGDPGDSVHLDLIGFDAAGSDAGLDVFRRGVPATASRFHPA